jgi:hypothetical protein
MIAIREALWRRDAEPILRIDSSFTTGTIYTAYREGDRLDLRLTELPAPITKRFPLDDLQGQEKRREFAVVAVVDDRTDDRICGFLAAAYQAWNRRLTIGPSLC